MRVRANARIAGLKVGQETDMPDGSLLRGLVRNGKVTILEVDPPPPAAKAAPKRRRARGG